MTDNFQVVKLLPLHYMHVKDVNKNIVKVVTGPRYVLCDLGVDDCRDHVVKCLPVTTQHNTPHCLHTHTISLYLQPLVWFSIFRRTCNSLVHGFKVEL